VAAAAAKEEHAMTAYVIVDVEVTDPERYKRYKDMAKPVVEAFGGQYLARAGRTETLEGDWAPTRLVILQFPSVEQAQTWVNSEEYRPARELRHATARTRMVVIEGYSGE
jgi:uncharacterized protein (DUF1330 family)